MDDTARFLAQLGERHLFQTFDDTGLGTEEWKRRHALCLAGTYEKHQRTLRKLNELGVGVFYTVNELKEGETRRLAENIDEVRAVFVDLDGAPLEPIRKLHSRKPHAIIETSRRKYHCLWFVHNCPIAKGADADEQPFTRVQRHLAKKFRGDNKVTDLPRVLRLPGYTHWKCVPFQSRLLELNNHKSLNFMYDFYAEAAEVYNKVYERDPRPRSERKDSTGRPLPLGTTKGGRNDRIFNVCVAMAHRGEPAHVIIQEALAEAALCRPPLSPGEARAAARSALRRVIR